MKIGKIITLIYIILVITFLSGCKIPEPTEITITNNVSEELGFILLDREGTIPLDLCSERGLNDKILVLESKYCGACKIAKPKLQEIEQELKIEFIWLDLSKKEDMERLKEFKIIPKYTPTILIGCEVLIGAYPKEKYKPLIENLLNAK